MGGNAGADGALDGETLDRSGLELEFAEDFAAPALNGDRWISHYLPHWTTPERSAARYELRPGLLRLRIDADQPAWRLEDGEMRVSNLQTGTFSGPLGSRVGQHRHRPDLTVRTPVPTRRCYTPSSGLVEAVMRASPDPTCMLAFWLVGFEEASPTASGEICVAELFGHAIGPERSRVRIGVKSHNDPRLRDDVEDIAVEFDATEWHTYGADWTTERIRFFVDDQLVRTVHQSIDYPLQLMVDLFEFPNDPRRDADAYPKVAEIQAVRGYRHVGAPPHVRATTAATKPRHPATASHENAEIVDLQVVVDAPTAAVWDALTNDDDRSRWWSYLSLEAHPGGRLIERWRDSGGQRRVTCGRVLEVEAPHRLRCSWRDDDWPESTDVEVTLRPAGDATCVRIRHSGWHRLGTRGSELCSTHVGGWQLHLANLKRFLERYSS